ncbi:ArsR/SmtB family transcription factor [Jeotgalibacillus proteolyticus]|uniref:ArsR family transcriptional regulator n=1 Tax=Jeotgalibacillus proteolyticus TaxID=2082395 RepID=A0A2S5G9S2_9BACL|nr:metalloregulator ArsR/SmtB family transcription factor [Jeotgalibacillus proteolyticus]PPA69752.1 ArsR family transcriptional regulator [Jeotgalibacillus proteolyticus]
MDVVAKEALSIDKASAALKLMGDKTRLTMLRILADHDCCVCEFVEIFNMSQPSISQHVRKMKDIGMIKEQRRGQWIMYSLNQGFEGYEMLQQVLHQLPVQDHHLEELIQKGKRISCE